MRFDIVTIFPEFFTGPLDYGIVRRARESGLIDVHVQDLRVFTHDRHRTVDDRPFGGGEGMVLKPEPLFEAVEALLGRRVAPAGAGSAASAEQAQAIDGPKPTEPAPAEKAEAPPMKEGVATIVAPSAAESALLDSTAVILLSASGKLFRQSTARRLAGLDRIVLLCGRYEGVDERVAEHLATEELSIGDFVLSGGELAAALVIDAVTRLLPGALGNEASSLHESFSAPADEGSLGRDAKPVVANAPDSPTRGLPQAAPSPLLVEFPHYTRPAEFRGWPVPEVLLGGNHEEIRRWRQRMALEKTRRNRPDLLVQA